MKKNLKTALTMMASAILLSSCHNNEPGYDSISPNMVVTVKTADDGRQFFQLDDETTLLPVNLKKTLFDGKQVRAFANCRETAEQSGEFTKAVEVFWIDSILTKKPVQSLGLEDKDVFGDAPVGIVDTWATVVEDDYLTLCFAGMWGAPGLVHEINLVTGTVEDDPYTLVLRHNACGDTAAYGIGTVCTGYVAFDLRGLPDTDGQTVDLKVKFQSLDEEKTAVFKYCTGKRAGTKAPAGKLPSRAAVVLR